MTTNRDAEIEQLKFAINTINPNIKWYEEHETTNEYSDKINLYGFYVARYKKQVDLVKKIIAQIKEADPRNELERLHKEYEIIEREILIADLEIKIANYSTWVKTYSNMSRLWENTQKEISSEIDNGGGDDVVAKITQKLNHPSLNEDKKAQARGLLIQYQNAVNKNETYLRMKDFLRQNP